MLNGRQCELRRAEMMAAIIISFVTATGQEINPWWYGNDDNDDNEILCEDKLITIVFFE